MQPRTHTQLHFEGSQYRASLVCHHFFKQPITRCPSTYLNILYLCSTNSYVTLPSVINHQTTQLHLRAMYNTYSYMWGPCIITSTLTVPLAISLHYTQSWFTSCSSFLAVESHSTKARQRSRAATIPPVHLTKSIFTTWKQSRFWKIFAPSSLPICYHGSPFKFKGAIIERKWRPLTHNRHYICSVYTKTALTE